MSTNNGQAPVNSETQQKIEEVIRNAQNVRNTQNKKAKKPNYEDSSNEELSSQISSQYAEIAQQLVEADKSATEARIKAGIVKGMKEIADINAGVQIGYALGLKQGTVQSTKKIIEDLDKLRNFSYGQIDLEGILSNFLPETTEKKPPLLMVEVETIGLLPSQMNFGIFEN